jgi:hypothetical protein
VRIKGMLPAGSAALSFFITLGGPQTVGPCPLLMTQCRTYGARILFGIDSPALPGWADVWRSALRASHP